MTLVCAGAGYGKTTLVSTWLAGQQLASLALRDAEDPAGFVASLSGLDAEFADYLALEVLSRQPAPVLSFLLQTAILDDFCVGLCEAAIPPEDPEWRARRCMRWLRAYAIRSTATTGPRWIAG